MKHGILITNSAFEILLVAKPQNPPVSRAGLESGAGFILTRNT